MATVLRRPLFLALLVLGCGAIPAQAQLEANLGGLTEMNAHGYLQPLPTGLSATMNAAVFRSGNVPTAGTHFSISLKAMAAEFGDDDRLYTPTDPVGFSSTAETEVPTVVGDTQSVPVAGSAGTVLHYPGGFDLEYFTLAAPQVTLGAFLGTRGVLRFASFDTGDDDLGKVELLGIGAQHSLSQYLPMFPVDVAAGFLYQTFEISDIVSAKALHVTLTGSRRFGMLEPYLGLGIDSFDLEAEYTYKVEDTEETIAVDFDRQTDPHLTLGLNFSVLLLSLHAEYNIAATNGVAAGLSFGI